MNGANACVHFVCTSHIRFDMTIYIVIVLPNIYYNCSHRDENLAYSIASAAPFLAIIKVIFVTRSRCICIPCEGLGSSHFIQIPMYYYLKSTS